MTISSALPRVAAAAVCCTGPVQAEVLECVVKSHYETTEDGLLAPAASALYLNSAFRVDVSTGEISGEPADNQSVAGRTIEVVDPGGPGMSVTILTTRGGVIGHLADLLVIKTWVERREKPFDYYSGNFGFFTGTCVRL